MSLKMRTPVTLLSCWGGLLGVIAVSLAPLPAVADSLSEPPISADTQINPRRVTIGDIITYSITVRHEPGIQVLPPNPFPSFEKGFEYIDQGISNPKRLKEHQEKTFWFKFRADAVGFYNISEIPVEFTAPSSANPSRLIPGILKAPEAVIEVRSVLFLDGEPNDIKDIKPIIGAGQNWRKYLQWALGILAILVIFGILLWKIGRSGKSAPATPVPTPNLKPHETALAELNQLMDRKLIESGQFREHYFELSEIFRRYLGSLLSIPALDWTTEEIGDFILHSVQLNPEKQQTVLTLLQSTDQIKFAKAPVELQTALQHVEAIRDFIRNTTPEMTSKFQVKTPMTA